MRAELVEDAKRQLNYKAAPGSTVRNLQVSASDVSGVMYQLALLPVWVGVYRYRDKLYRVLVNGQTKEVAGDKPKDSVKIALMAVAAVVAVVLLATLASVFLLHRCKFLLQE